MAADQTPDSHPENLIPGTDYLFLIHNSDEELVGGVAQFQGLELHDRRLHVALHFHDESIGLERWVAWLDVVHVLDPREITDTDEEPDDAAEDL